MSRYSQPTNVNQNVHFSKALVGETSRSRMTANPLHLTTFNAGDIVPIYCREVLPNQDLSLSLRRFVIRQTTLQTPTMGSMEVSFYSFFVPNRIVNKSFKAVQGENFSGSWTAPQVSLAPLVNTSTGNTIVPVGSVADYYGFPTQQAIPNSVLNLCHDLKFRGYVMIYNEFFRDQNYQPPIPISYLNIYQGFMDNNPANSVAISLDIDQKTTPDGSLGAGAIAHELYGSGVPNSTFRPAGASGRYRFRAVQPPLKANKLHDYFTSVLPSPNKGLNTLVPITGTLSPIPVRTTSMENVISSYPALKLRNTNGDVITETHPLYVNPNSNLSHSSDTSPVGLFSLFPSNLSTASVENVSGLTFDLTDVRTAAAFQQVYEVLARGGSRYREITRSFFGIEAEDPYDDVPICLGRVRAPLELYQTAQTSSSESGSTPQGNLAGFGYTSSSCNLFSNCSFLEHGYIHVFAVVRHRNIYSSYLSRDNFRLNMFDYYHPQLANISEQPVFTREINPFAPKPNAGFGYQEAWAEYRFEPDYVTGLMRTGVEGSLALWNYADDFSSSLQISDGNWLKSNSQSVLDRSLAVTSDVSPQFKGEFEFEVDKELPMPTYSLPGMDII